MEKKVEIDQQMEFLSSAYISKKLYEKYSFEAGKEYGLTISEGEVLMHIHLQGGESTARDIVEHNWISKSQVSKSVERLTARGYLTSAADENDRRLMRLRLTEAAEQPVKELEKAARDYLNRLFAGLDNGEIQELNRLLSKMAANVRKENDK